MAEQFPISWPSRGVVSRDKVYVNQIATFSESPLIRFYNVETLPRLCRNSPDNGYSLIIVPGFSEVHSSFARNAPNYEEMYLKPLIGWVAGIHLDDLGKVTPKVRHGQNRAVLGPDGGRNGRALAQREVCTH